METQKFFLKIDAESPDGEAVRCETQIKVNCEKGLSAVIVAKILRDNIELKEIFMEAFIVLMTTEDETTSEKISDEEYKKRLDGDVEL